MKRVRKRLTFANVVAFIALFVALGGASYAAIKLPKNSVGTKQIKKNAVTTAKIKNGAASAAKIQAASIGKGQLGVGSVGNGQTQLVKVFKAGAVPVTGEEATATKVPLGSVGPFTFYGKCFKSGANVEEKTYIELTSGPATLGSEDAAEFNDNGTGYLTPATPERERYLEDDVSAGPNSFDATSYDEEFQASASDGTEITGLAAGTGAKQGSPPAGDGPFLAGDSCVIGTIAIFGN